MQAAPAPTEAPGHELVKAERAREPLLLSWSGGKDSALTLHTLRADPAVDVAGLLTTVTRDHGRISMHGVRLDLLAAQAAALGLPVTPVEIAPGAANEAYERALAVTLAGARDRGITRVAFGDLYLADVRAYREAQLARAGMRAVFPVWQRDTAAFAGDVVALGFRAVVVCVDTEQLHPAFCGREFDERFLADLPDGVDPCGENGEYHTFVYDGPGFAAAVGLRRGRQVTRDGRFRYQDLVPA